VTIPDPRPEVEPQPDDQQDWDRERFGSMVTAATGPEGEPETQPWEPDEDETEV